MKMDVDKRNGSSVQPEVKEYIDSDQEEVTGKIRVLVHQDAFDIPEDMPKRNNSSAERHHLFGDTKPIDFHPKIIEPDDIITPLSEESDSSVTGQICEEKPSVEQEDTISNSWLQTLFPCWGTIIDPSSMTIGRFLGVIACFLFYVGNILTNIAVCYHLFFHGNWLWFSLVAAFTIIPTVILNCISYHLSVNKRKIKRNIWNQEESCVISFVIALLHLSQFGIIAR